MRLIFVPQFPVQLRYQEWWLREFEREFSAEFDEVITLGVSKNCGTSGASFDTKLRPMFAPVEASIRWELSQIEDYLSIKIYNDDIMFISDLSFPGLFMNVLAHKRPGKIFSFAHATSLNYLDYFARVRTPKSLIEKGHAAFCDAVFVGSEYHKKKLEKNGILNAVVTYLPYPPFTPTKGLHKSFNIVSASRPTPQKVDLELERMVERETKQTIHRMEHSTWEQYFTFLGMSHALFISAQEETFGYQVVDAVLSGCIPIAPNRYSYPELLPREYLYENEEEAIDKVKDVLYKIDMRVPELLCDMDMKRFYRNIIETMKGL